MVFSKIGKGDEMDPFGSGSSPNRGQRAAPDINFVNFPEPRSLDDLEYGSNPERIIGKGVSTLKRVCSLIMVCAGILFLIALAPPFIRFLFEFSKYTFSRIGKMFP